MSASPTVSNGFSVLRHRNFTFYLFARTLGTLAVQMQNVAIGWQVYSMTGNLFDLGLIGLCLLYTSPSPRDRTRSRMPSSA